MQGDYTGAERTDYDDSSWETIGIPHSFSIPYFMSKDFYTGYGWVTIYTKIGASGQASIEIRKRLRLKSTKKRIIIPVSYTHLDVYKRQDVGGREEILGVHAKKKPLAEDVDLKQIAQTTAGFTGADLEKMCIRDRLVPRR